MNPILYILIGGGILIIFGICVDWYYKKHGIIVNPAENEKHVSEFERTNVENMMREIKNNHDTQNW